MKAIQIKRNVKGIFRDRISPWVLEGLGLGNAGMEWSRPGEGRELGDDSLYNGREGKVSGNAGFGMTSH